MTTSEHGVHGLGRSWSDMLMRESGAPDLDSKKETWNLGIFPTKGGFTMQRMKVKIQHPYIV